MRRYSNYSLLDEEEGPRYMRYCVIDCVLALLMGMVLTSAISSVLWTPMPSPEESRVQCTSETPYNVATREYLQLGSVYVNGVYYHTGHYSVQKQLPVDVTCIMHLVVCNGRSVVNWTHVYVEDAFQASEETQVVEALKRVTLLRNATRYTYEWCSWDDCLYTEPVEEWWGVWFGLWCAGVVCSSVVFAMPLLLSELFHRHYQRVLDEIDKRRSVNQARSLFSVSERLPETRHTSDNEEWSGVDWKAD